MLKIFLGKGCCNFQFSYFKISLYKIDFNGRMLLYNIKPKDNSIVQAISEITEPIELKFSISFLPLNAIMFYLKLSRQFKQIDLKSLGSGDWN